MPEVEPYDQLDFAQRICDYGNILSIHAEAVWSDHSLVCIYKYISKRHQALINHRRANV